MFSLAEHPNPTAESIRSALITLSRCEEFDAVLNVGKTDDEVFAFTGVGQQGVAGRVSSVRLLIHILTTHRCYSSDASGPRTRFHRWSFP